MSQRYYFISKNKFLVIYKKRFEDKKKKKRGQICNIPYKANLKS